MKNHAKKEILWQVLNANLLMISEVLDATLELNLQGNNWLVSTPIKRWQ